MANSRSRWRDKVRGVVLKYSALRVSVDWLLTATPEEIHEVAQTGDHLDPHRGAIYQADESLAATYLIRMFSAFEMASKSYWRTIPANPQGNPDMIDAIDDIGSYLHIPYDLIEQTQLIRILRNDLIHDWNRSRVLAVDLPENLNHLIKFLGFLPLTWA